MAERQGRGKCRQRWRASSCGGPWSQGGGPPRRVPCTPRGQGTGCCAKRRWQGACGACQGTGPGRSWPWPEGRCWGQRLGKQGKGRWPREGPGPSGSQRKGQGQRQSAVRRPRGALPAIGLTPHFGHEGIPRAGCGGGWSRLINGPRLASVGLQDSEGTYVWRFVHDIPAPQARHEGIPRASSWAVYGWRHPPLLILLALSCPSLWVLLLRGRGFFGGFGGCWWGALGGFGRVRARSICRTPELCCSGGHKSPADCAVD